MSARRWRYSYRPYLPHRCSSRIPIRPLLRAVLLDGDDYLVLHCRRSRCKAFCQCSYGLRKRRGGQRSLLWRSRLWFLGRLDQSYSGLQREHETRYPQVESLLLDLSRAFLLSEFHRMAGYHLTLFLLIIGAACATAITVDQAWSDAYTTGSVGGLLGIALSPAGGFGKFCLVLLALSIVANNIPNNYSVDPLDLVY